jgi:hypothetical protein
VNALASAISASLRLHDPLDPWLTESGWDEHYWDGEAEEIARRLSPEMSKADVRRVVVAVLGSLLGTSADGEAGLREQSRRLDLVAAETAQLLATAT